MNDEVKGRLTTIELVLMNLLHRMPTEERDELIRSVLPPLMRLGSTAESQAANATLERLQGRFRPIG